MHILTHTLFKGKLVILFVIFIKLVYGRPQDVESAPETQYAQDVENTQDVQTTQHAENADNAQYAQNPQYAQNTNPAEILDVLRNGRYLPAVYGADRGKYVHDDSGRYIHVNIPYDGGYGDRGIAYLHIEPTRGPGGDFAGLQLGTKDHLRFSVDFNFNNNGWQIVQLIWKNDENEEKSYDYKYERQLWTGADNTLENPIGSSTKTKSIGISSTPATVKGEFKDDIYNVSYSNANKLSAQNKANIQDVISQVLEYIQNKILPSLR